MKPLSISACKNFFLRKIRANPGVKPSFMENLLNAGEAELDKPLNRANFVVIDTELTGLDLKKDSIVSIGAIKFTEGKIELGNFFYRVIQPETDLKKESIVIHGITPTEAMECPGIGILLPEFINFCKGRVIVGYCVDIDISFINKEVKKIAGFNLQNPAIDTFGMHCYITKKEEQSDAFCPLHAHGATLFELAKKHDISTAGAHNALSDAFITAQLFQRFVGKMERFGIETVRDLLRISKS
ncbi:MAG: 3'-5' exonuclease [Dissulfurispiraceae bacterium]|jgi:DNA polymerase-3 subunit epsilon|nr:3'-5' exonuclease [Dissulfurispiraceae bacterium]